MSPKKLTIGIDASRTTQTTKTGIEVYSLEIIKALISQNRDDFVLWANAQIPEELTPLPENCTWKELPGAKLWSQYRLGMETIFHNPTDVIFIPSHVLPIIHKGKFVVTIHDLAFKHYPELYTRSERFYHNLAVKTAVQSAKKILVPSKFTKTDLINFYHAKSTQIEVVYHGLNHSFFKPGQPHALPIEIKEKYLLYIGRLEKKKNIIKLIEAYNLLRRESDTTHKLVLVGKAGYGYEEIVKTIDSLPEHIKADVIVTGYLSDEDRLALLQGADIYVTPSLFEGFGLTALEAMACGVPVVASNTTSLAEVVAEAGLLVDPEKPLSIAAAMSRLIHHPQEKKDLIKRGLEHAKNFTWQAAGSKTLEIIESVGYRP